MCKVVDYDQLMRRFYTYTIHSERIGIIVEAYPGLPSQKSSEPSAKQRDWTNLIQAVGSLLAPLSDLEFDKEKKILVTKLALLLTAGRAGSRSIVKDSYPSSLAGISVSEHVGDFLDFIVDLQEFASDVSSDEAKNAFLRLVRYIEGQRRPRATNAQLGSYAQRCYEANLGRIMFRTESGLLGMGPVGYFGTRIGDQIMVLRGGRVPFVLRPVRKGSPFLGIGTHRLIGDCYVYGAMEKQFDEKATNASNTFTLV